MTAETKFEGWMGYSPEAGEGKMKWDSFKPKKWKEDDVDIKVTHCGVCGTDLHILRSGWFPSLYRMIIFITPTPNPAGDPF